jgi:Niemann-Pick C1 protein
LEVLLSLTCVDIDLVGVLKLWGLHINSITVINLVMAIGLVVDYSLHLVHCFSRQDPTLEVDA